MLRQVQKTIKGHQLIFSGQHILIGVSGGADSVALTCLLHHLQSRLKVKLTLVHLNHKIRGQRADEDQRFVEALANKLGLAFITQTRNIPRLAREKKWSLEMAAREARHDFYRSTLKRFGTQSMALAHTSDDQAETVLLKLVRGAGVQGLSAMDYQCQLKGIHVVRPMLDVTHQAAIDFLKKRGQEWREDESNQDFRFQRNRVRHEVIPLLEATLNPSLRQALVRTADLCREENKWMNDLTCYMFDASLDPVYPAALKLDVVNQYSIAARRRILLCWLTKHHVDVGRIDYQLIDRLLSLIRCSAGTKNLSVSKDVRVIRNYDRLLIERNKDGVLSPFKIQIKAPGITCCFDQNIRVQTTWARGWVKQERGPVGDFPAHAFLNAQRIGWAKIYIRSWNPGDRFNPLGFKGSKKIQDIFVDQKVPQQKRPMIPLVQCRDEIIWVPGYQIACGWEVKDSQTRTLHITMELVPHNK
ncbi:MAG: tRNA lysidine(34) synthetase TilS [Kiritimatiellae bacterium]|nr:tRNA lysidine(34) synthetase TilS [Kiritimatiellia bacterium]